MTKSTTQYINIEGKIKWPKVYEPDEFRGASRYSVNLYPKDDAQWNKIKPHLNPRKVIKEDEDGKYLVLYRPTTKLIKNRLVTFSPPIIYNKDGTPAVSYVDNDSKIIRSYDDAENKPVRAGEPISIGNGSSVLVTVCVYNTAMGPGSRLESLKLLDLIEYKPEPKENPVESKETKGTESVQAGDALPPW